MLDFTLINNKKINKSQIKLLRKVYPLIERRIGQYNEKVIIQSDQNLNVAFRKSFEENVSNKFHGVIEKGSAKNVHRIVCS